MRSAWPLSPRPHGGAADLEGRRGPRRRGAQRARPRHRSGRLAIHDRHALSGRSCAWSEGEAMRSPALSFPNPLSFCELPLYGVSMPASDGLPCGALPPYVCDRLAHWLGRRGAVDAQPTRVAVGMHLSEALAREDATRDDDLEEAALQRGGAAAVVERERRLSVDAGRLDAGQVVAARARAALPGEPPLQAPGGVAHVVSPRGGGELEEVVGRAVAIDE